MRLKMEGNDLPKETANYNEIEKLNSSGITVEPEKQDNAEETRLKNLRRAFDSIDENKTGHICAYELHEMTKKFGQNFSKAEILEFLKKYDKDETSHLSFDEYVNMVDELGHK